MPSLAVTEARTRTTEYGPERYCRRCEEWWPDDAEFWRRIRRPVGERVMSGKREYRRRSEVIVYRCLCCDREADRRSRERKAGIYVVLGPVPCKGCGWMVTWNGWEWQTGARTHACPSTVIPQNRRSQRKFVDIRIKGVDDAHEAAPIMEVSSQPNTGAAPVTLPDVAAA